MNISTTLKKIEKALNLRFEKDSSLYISKEDTEKIKKALEKSQFQNINAFIKKFGNKIVGKIIIDYNWLINFNRNKKELTQIFNSIDKNFLKDIAKDIVEDKVYSSVEFKLFIKQYYLETEPLKECQKIYRNENERIENRIVCFKRYLKEEYIKENSASNIVRFIDSEFKNYPIIYNTLQAKENNFLISIFKNYNDKEHLYQWIIENKISDKKDKIWYNLFLLDKDIAFDKSVEYISNNPNWDNSITKFLIQRILAKLNRVDSFEEKIIELYKNNRYIRLLFIHMLEPDKFKNKELAHSILDEFEDIDLPNKSDESVEKIRNWNSDNSIKGFEEADEILERINSNNENFTNLGTLNFYALQLNKTKKDTILFAYYNYSMDENIKIILSYYLARFLERRDIPKDFNDILNDKIYIDKITYFIEKLHINTKFAKKFLEQNDKYELLTKFNKR
jgi:hypothetical protein